MKVEYVNTITRSIGTVRSLFSNRSPAKLSVSDQLATARESDLVELDKREIATAKTAVEAGRQYRVFVKVVSNSARHDAAILTFLVDPPPLPEEAEKYFPRFTTAVGKPFAFIPNKSEAQNEGMTLVQFTAPPGARSITIAARRWASEGEVKIGTCLAMQTEGDRTVRATRFDLPGERLCELAIDTSRVAHLATVAVCTLTLDFRDAQHQPLDAGRQWFRLAVYPGPPPVAAALALPFEAPIAATEMIVGIAAEDERLPDLLRIALRALDRPADVAGFIAALNERLDHRATAVRASAASALPASKDDVDEWLCSEKAAALQRAAALFGPRAESGTAPTRQTMSLSVVPGTILEIRLVPVLLPELPEPRTATLTASFFDADDKVLPHAGHQLSWSQWMRNQYPLSFAGEAFDQQEHFAVPHYVIVPPRAASLTVQVSGAAGLAEPGILVEPVTVYDNEVARLVQRAIAYLDERSRFVTRLSRCLPAESEKMILSTAAAEHQSGADHLRLLRSFLLSPPESRVWRAARATTSFDIKGLPQRLPELDVDAATPASSDTRLRIGVIGSRDFLYYLSIWHEVTPLTPDVMQLAAALLPLDLVVLQQSDRLAGGWPQAFFGFLDGAIPPSTLELIRSLRKRGVPVVLVADPSPTFLRLTESWAAEVDRLVICGPEAEDAKATAALADRPNFVRFPVLVEMRLHRPVIEERRAAFSILCSSISDLFDFRGNIPYLERIADAGLVLADRHWRLVIERAKENLQAPELAERVFGSASTEQWAFLCRHAAVALFFEDSLLPRYKAAQCMAEAIANGAVVVYVGDSSQLGELAESVVAVDTPYQLSLVLRQLRFDWHREQVWLRAFRCLHRQSRFERLATWLHGIVVADAPTQPVAPKATMITISKRPHLLGYCLDKFSRQTYGNVELVLVLNTDVDDSELNEFSDTDPRVQIYKAPKELNIGYCLNMAISAARGQIWLKCDDDDFYGPHYVEDMVNTFYFSGADIVGKPQCYTYFEDQDAIYVRTIGRERERSVLRPGNEFLTGATLSAKTEATIRDNLWFSSTIRMANDSEWVRAAAGKGLSIFFADRNNFVIHRSADLGDHTWTMSDEELRKRSVQLVAGLRHDFIC